MAGPSIPRAEKLADVRHGRWLLQRLKTRQGYFAAALEIVDYSSGNSMRSSALYEIFCRVADAAVSVRARDQLSPHSPTDRVAPIPPTPALLNLAPAAELERAMNWVEARRFSRYVFDRVILWLPTHSAIKLRNGWGTRIGSSSNGHKPSLGPQVWVSKPGAHGQT